MKVWDKMWWSTDADVGMREGPISHLCVRWSLLHVSGRIWGWQEDIVPSVNSGGPDRTFLSTSMVVRVVMERVTRGSAKVLPCGQTRGGAHRHMGGGPHNLVVWSMNTTDMLGACAIFYLYFHGKMKMEFNHIIFILAYTLQVYSG